MILSCLYIDGSDSKGRGVYTSENLEEGTLIEESPVIVMGSEERKWLDKTLLHDYIFEWGNKKDQCCVALGYVSLYNHSYKSNCEYEMNYKEKLISIRAVHFIKAGEELLVNYNGDWDNQKKIWFDAAK